MLGTRISIAGKLMLGSVTNVVLVLVLAGLTYWTVDRLRAMQDDGAVTAQHATRITEASYLGAQMYQVIADAEINRDLPTTAKDWAAQKAAAEDALTRIAEAASEEAQKTALDTARKDYAEVVRLFEQEMLPKLQATPEMTGEIRDLDGRIDETVAAFATALSQVRDVEIKHAAALDTEFDAVGVDSTLINMAVAGFAVVVALGAAFALARSITRPIRGMTAAMGHLAAGDRTTAIPGGERRDEIGEMSKAVLVFKENMLEADRLRTEQEAQKRQAEAERRRLMHDMADRFESTVGEVLKGVTSSSTELQATAQAMSASAEEASRQSTVVAAASDEATQNVQTVASATEELSASIHEIGAQVTESTCIVGDAVSQANDTNAKVQSLAEAAARIGDVVRLINDIAGQTNLLALNATIEAARAGEAGKGFAVVASEVKVLATQTAKATDEITAQVQAIQQATQSSVIAIQGIAQTINRVNEISTAIASAVEEQGAATQEIARNVQQAAQGTTEVSSNIGSVTQVAQETGAAATQLLSSAGELARNGTLLRSQVDDFLREVRA